MHSNGPPIGQNFDPKASELSSIVGNVFEYLYSEKFEMHFNCPLWLGKILNIYILKWLKWTHIFHQFEG